MIESESKEMLEIYSLNNESVSVTGPVRISILHLLSRKPGAGFSQIQEEVGLSKSTVSEYLASLVSTGLIKEVKSETDGRKKSYVLAAKRVGNVELSKPAVDTGEFREIIRKAHKAGCCPDYKSVMQHIIKVALIEAGVKIDPIILRGAEIFGESLAPYLVSDTLDKTLENIGEFWSDNGLGDIKVISVYPVITVEIYNCYECMTMPKGQNDCCVMSKGVLNALFNAFYHQKVAITETQCMSEGYECCSFEIIPPLYEEF